MTIVSGASRLFARRRWLDVVAAAYAAVYVVWVVVHRPGPLNDIVADAAFLPLGLVVGWAYLRNARVAGLDVRTRLAWGLLAFGALTLWVSGSAFSHYIRLTGPQATPPWIDYLEYLQLSLTLAASVVFPGLPSPRKVPLRFLLDVGLVVVAGFVLAVHYGMAIAPPGTISDLTREPLIRTALNWAVFVALSIGLFYKRDRTTRVVLGYLLAANVAVIAGNWFFSRDVDYRSGDPVDLLWFLAWVLKYSAAKSARDAYARDPVPRGSQAVGMGATTFPYVVVGAAVVLLIRAVVTGDLYSVRFLSYGSLTMAGLLVVRQVVELRENRRLYAAQLAQDAWFRSLVQHASDLTLVVDDGGVITYASPSAGRLLGSAALAGEPRMADLVHPEDWGTISQLLSTRFAQASRLQCRLSVATGDWRDIEIIATDMRDDPAVGQVVLNGRDITDRTELERQLRHAQKLDAVGHLAGGLAHDFNNVLAAIRGYTELIREQLRPGTPAAEDLAYIEQAVDRAAAVTRKLLAFSRRQPVQRTVVDLNKMLTGLEPLLRQMLTDRIEVRIEADPGVWPVKADSGQLEQAVINLCTNARDAMPDGGVLFLATANRTIAEPSVETGSLSAGDYAALVVTDQGVGMSAETQARIFEPFFSTKPKDRGIGLGLAMVHGIVTGSGGGIHVDSVPGRGSSFTLLLPRTTDAPASASPVEPMPEIDAHARRVLLVDDELGVRTVARRMLERGGYRVVEAAGGVEALAVLERLDTVDVLVTDMVMPGMHGRDLVARARALRPTLPVVSITGYAGEIDHLGGVPDVTAVVTKPFSSATLLRAVAAALTSASP